jgi:hypothetical protein
VAVLDLGAPADDLLGYLGLGQTSVRPLCENSLPTDGIGYERVY